MKKRAAKKKPVAKKKASLSGATLKRRYSRGGLKAVLQCAYLFRSPDSKYSLNLEFSSGDGQFFEADIPIEILTHLLSLAVQANPDTNSFEVLLGQPVRKSWTRW
jgi:hypothetical protein